MVVEPTERVALGSSGVRVTRLGFGTAEIGGLYRAVSDADAAATLEHAWAAGVGASKRTRSTSTPHEESRRRILADVLPLWAPRKQANQRYGAREENPLDAVSVE